MRRLEVASLDDLGREIQAVLRQDKAGDRMLMWSASRGGRLEFDGYCAVASAAYFFLSGEALLPDSDPTAEIVDWAPAGQAALAAGLQPMQLTLRQGWPRRRESRHWWIVRDRSDLAYLEVIDLTIGPDEEPGDYPYDRGGRRAFMQTGYKRPNKTRALPLIERIKQARRDQMSSR